MKSIRFNRLIKALQIVFAILLLTSVSLIVTACECDHEYEEEVTKPATCTSVGEVSYTCSKCGDIYTDTIPMLDGHKLSARYLSDISGHWQKCDNCDYTTEKVAHIFAYQKQGNLHWQQCEACGYATDKVEHTFTIQGAIIPSTCTSQGSSTKACVCGEADTEALQLANHSYTAYQKEGNLHWQKCDNCDAITERTEHVFTIQGTIVPSTCTEQGSDTKACVCGATHIDTLPLAQHSYTKVMYNDDEHWAVCIACGEENANQARTPHDLTTKTTEPDCENGGKSVTTCSGCNYEKTEVLPKLEHKLDKTAFSKSSTGSGHYYKCILCNKDVAEPHTLVECECPNGYQCEATCYQTGHQDERCSICNYLREFSTPITNEHNFSSQLEYNGAVHWYPCTNGNGACSARGYETAHTWNEVVVQPTCTDNGSSKRQCECGAIQSGSNKTLTKLGHDYVTVEIIKEATCDHKDGNGMELQRCTRCEDEIEVVTERLKCVMEGYYATIDGHYLQCINCGFTQTTLRNHTWIDEVKKEATCTESGLTVRTCEYCNFTYNQVTTKNHVYVTDPNSYVHSTCMSYQTHVGTCAECGDTQVFVDEYLGYANHIVKEFAAKEMTETEPGNRHYWQCTVCNKYFTSHGCVEELTEDQVFTYPPTLTRLDSIDKLVKFAQTLPDQTVSDDYYQITATVIDIYSNENTLMIDDGTSIFATLVAKENIYTISKNDEITLKGKLIRSNSYVELVDCQIISVDCHVSGLHSVFITVTEEYEYYCYIYANVIDDEKDLFLANTNNYNCVLDGDTLILHANVYGNVVLQKLIINGKSYTMTESTLEIEVTENIYAEFVLATHNYCSVRISELDTSNNNGNAIAVDEYISYTYTNGGYNDDGRLHKNSHLTFSVENANITGINITYEADWLNDYPQVLNNTVNAIKESGTKVTVEQGSANGNSQIKITLSASEAYKALEYFANQSQARVVEIIVLYETYNTCGK